MKHVSRSLLSLALSATLLFGAPGTALAAQKPDPGKPAAKAAPAAAPRQKGADSSKTKAQNLTLAQSVDQLNWSLFDRLATPQKNIVYSPYSIEQTILNAAYDGSETTKSQICKTFGFASFDDARSRANAYSLDHPSARLSVSHQEILSSAIVTRQGLSLVDRVNFDGVFQTGFPWDYTEKGTFHGANGDKPATMLRNTLVSMHYYDGETFSGLNLPYGDSGASLLLIVPKSEDNVVDLWKSMTTTERDSVVKKVADSGTVPITSVTVPRVRMNGTVKELPKSLQALGVKSLFTTLTGVYVNEMTHTVKFQIDEKGTAPDSVRAPIARPTCKIPPREKIRFAADKPFLFFVRDNHNGMILITGVVEHF